MQMSHVIVAVCLAEFLSVKCEDVEFFGERIAKKLEVHSPRFTSLQVFAVQWTGEKWKDANCKTSTTAFIHLISDAVIFLFIC